MKALPLSVSIISFNEEIDLPRCLRSVEKIASEIVIVDSGSTDGTRKVADNFGAKFFHQDWLGHIEQKNVALSKCSQPWILCLDCDEEVSEVLVDNIRKRIENAPEDVAGFEVNRKVYYLGRWIEHAWYPDWKLRLVRNGKATWGGYNPHDQLIPTGKVMRLQGDLHHYSYRNIMDHLSRTLQYARIISESYWKLGRRTRWHHLIFSPAGAFLKKMVLKSAWRDGWRGWVIAGSAALSVFAKYALLKEKEWEESSRPSR